MKRAFAIAIIAELVLATLILQSSIKDFLWNHPWWHSFLVAIPVIAVPILAYFELRHSSEANSLRGEANAFRGDSVLRIPSKQVSRGHGISGFRSLKVAERRKLCCRS
jgi:hypothetical protein